MTFLMAIPPIGWADTSETITTSSLPEWVRHVDAAVRGWVDNGAILGAELLVIQHGDTILHTVRGVNRVEESQPLRKDQIYRIHSMTKPMTATAIFMLVEDGTLSLDDRVAEYIEAYRNDRCRQITIRQLLYHTAGFGQPAYPRGSIDLYSSLEEAVTDLAEHGPEHTPGEEYHYSDGHSATLGLIIQKVTGMPPEQFLEEHIFEPLGMQDTYCDIGDIAGDRVRLCNVYIWREGGYQMLWDHRDSAATPFFRASGGVVTTTADYARFLRLWMDGTTSQGRRLLSDSMIHHALLPSALKDDYGMHWEIYHPASDTASLPVFGHGGSSGTAAIALPEHDAMVLYFSQSRGTLSGNFLTQLVLQELGYTQPKQITPVTVCEATCEAIAGDYFIRDDLWRVQPTKVGINLMNSRLVPIEFVAVSDTFYVQPYLDWDVRFVKEDDGAIGGFIFRLQEREVEAVRQ